MMDRNKLGKVIQDAFQRYTVQGTPEFPTIPGSLARREGPWHLIDASKADPDVGWPGELIAEFEGPDSYSEAWAELWRLVADAAAEAMFNNPVYTTSDRVDDRKPARLPKNPVSCPVCGRVGRHKHGCADFGPL